LLICSPSRMCFPWEDITEKKKPVILLYSHATAHEEVRGRHGGNPQIKRKITPYNKFMGGIDSSGMMLYIYLDERRTAHDWKKVAFNMVCAVFCLYTLSGVGIGVRR
jgi:hypothetical protein